MKLAHVENPTKYKGLYIIDYGDHSSIGYTADEVAQILESEQYANVKVYKIRRAYPDGQMELKGVPAETFHLEMGMFFYAHNEKIARKQYDRLIEDTQTHPAPARAVVQLAKLDAQTYVTALIFPAEHNDEFSSWLIDCDYRTTGQVTGGVSALIEYRSRGPQIIESTQLHAPDRQDRPAEELFAKTGEAVQR
ncbi:hypothetical protein STSP2_00536 [Anaerohalosphaera lusitana]|uniref:Uncharacterized protein n=1 Tax=Anaerohalosphaera lusitana TaxID=1936003 RepID=A0A1U9NHI5_9BACT|nr:hypothetical protein [Anaerohalosphaera lusitana]AQT67392.1 hypothetical protein STSP2_00536 [Anaerohalosphaera lusitana]